MVLCESLKEWGGGWRGGSREGGHMYPMADSPCCMAETYTIL